MRNGADDGSLIPVLYLHRWEEDGVNLTTLCWSIPAVIPQHPLQCSACWRGQLAHFFYHWLKDFLPCPTYKEAPWLDWLVFKRWRPGPHPVSEVRLHQGFAQHQNKVLFSVPFLMVPYTFVAFWQSPHIELMISESSQRWLWDPFPGNYHFWVQHHMHPVWVIFLWVCYFKVIYTDAHLPPFCQLTLVWSPPGVPHQHCGIWLLKLLSVICKPGGFTVLSSAWDFWPWSEPSGCYYSHGQKGCCTIQLFFSFRFPALPQVSLWPQVKHFKTEPLWQGYSSIELTHSPFCMQLAAPRWCSAKSFGLPLSMSRWWASTLVMQDHICQWTRSAAACTTWKHLALWFSKVLWNCGTL